MECGAFKMQMTCESGGSVQVLDQYLERVTGWMEANKLSLNSDKVEVLWLGTSWVQELRKQPVLNGIAFSLKERACCT